ncbi:MAG TPA: ROK family protein [Mycobacteriales bacterium]|nr:ROK family protein [Mycobacteriales bacterium]
MTPSGAGDVTLCVDVGGSSVKGGSVGPDGALRGERIRIETGYPFAPAQLLDAIARIAEQSAPASRLAVGFPGMVRAGVVLSAPHFVTVSGPGSDKDPALVDAWTRLPLAEQASARVGLPCRLANDADVQGLAAIEGRGLEMVLTLGTGLGSALFLDGEPAPHLELAHHPLRRRKTYNEMVGEAARREVGDRHWSRRVDAMVRTVAALVFYDRLYLGGGNAIRLTDAFRQDATIIDNLDGILGGARLWTLARVP